MTAIPNSAQTPALIWLHEDALRSTHPALRHAEPDAAAVHIWDDAYLRRCAYSLKRLVFLYESVCDLRLNVVHGDTLTVLRESPADRIVIPASPNPFIRSIAAQLGGKQVSIVADEPFVRLPLSSDFRRFFAYWKQAEKSAFMPAGGPNAQRSA